MTQKVILDIDNALTIPAQDTDDALALALALVSPELEVLGCTTSAGNCRTNQSTHNTLSLLQAGGIKSLPVAEGHPSALARDREPHFRYLAAKTAGSEKSYWDNLPEPPPTRTVPLGTARFGIHLRLCTRSSRRNHLYRAGGLDQSRHRANG